MPIVTKIELIGTDGKKCRIYIDHHYKGDYQLETIYRLKIDKDKEIDEKLLEEMEYEEQLLSCKQYGIRLVSRSLYTEGQIVDKMAQRQYSQEIIDSAVALLKEYGYINDTYYSEAFIKNSQNVSKYGKRKIQMLMHQKHIEKKTISKTIDEHFDDEIEFENAFKLAEKKYALIKNEETIKIKAKLYRYLSYRGFEADIVNKVVRRIIKSNEGEDYE